MEKPRCVCCGASVTFQFYLCTQCEAKYGKRKDEWDPWLLFLVNDEAKERMRQMRGYYNREMPFSDIDDIEEIPYYDTDVM